MTGKQAENENTIRINNTTKCGDIVWAAAVGHRFWPAIISMDMKSNSFKNGIMVLLTFARKIPISFHLSQINKGIRYLMF